MEVTIMGYIGVCIGVYAAVLLGTPKDTRKERFKIQGQGNPEP